MKAKSFAALAMLVCALFATQPACAQVDDTPWELEHDEELASIDTESRWATGLYVASIHLTVGGAATTVMSVLMSAGCVYGCDGDLMALFGTGLATFGLGLASLVTAIVLDIDSGNRRESHGRSQLRLEPRAGGGTLSFAGTF